MTKQKQRGHGEGSIYQRPDGRWVGQITLDDGKRKYLYGKTRKEVAEKLHQALQEQKQGLLATGPQQKLADYLEFWLEEVHKPAIKLTSYLRYRTLLNKHIIPDLGYTVLQKLSVRHIQSFYAKKVKEGLSAQTVHILHAILHKALHDAMLSNLVARNVSDNLSLPRIEKHETRTLTVQQAQKLEGTGRRMILSFAMGMGSFFIQPLSSLRFVTYLRRQDLNVFDSMTSATALQPFCSRWECIPKSYKSCLDIARSA